MTEPAEEFARRLISEPDVLGMSTLAAEFWRTAQIAARDESIRRERDVEWSAEFSCAVVVNCAEEEDPPIRAETPDDIEEAASRLHDFARHAALVEAEKVVREWPEEEGSSYKTLLGFVADALRRLREGE